MNINNLTLLNITLTSFINIKTILLATIVLSAWLTYKVLKRSDKNAKPGCIGFGYFFLIFFTVTSLSVSGVVFFSKTVYNYFTLPKYTATVIDHEVYEKEESYNSNGRTSYRTVTMYRPKVKFVDNQNDTVEIYNDISSGEPKPIGSTINIGYKTGQNTAQEFSLKKLFLMCGLSVMMLILGYIVVAAIQYALGKNMQKTLKFGAKLVLQFLVPLGMITMCCLLSFALYQYFSGQKPDMPMWAVIICGFFAFVLFLSSIAYIKTIRSKNHR